MNKSEKRAPRSTGVGRRKLHFRWYVWLPLIVVSVLCCTRSNLGLLNWAMRFFGNPGLMFVFVGLLASAGAMVCLESCRRLGREKKLLESKDLKNRRSEAALVGYKEQLEADKKTQSMVYVRLDTVLKSIESGARADRVERERVLPRLSALHDIALHAELSRWDSAFVAALLSFLLVLGILGTLTGVHGVLADSFVNQEIYIDLKKLAMALLPSAVAVGGTIVLIILRGRYMRRVADCLAQLDELTMTVILPVLLRREKAVSHGKLASAIEKLPELQLEKKEYKSRVEQYQGIRGQIQDLLQEKSVAAQIAAPYAPESQNDVRQINEAKSPQLPGEPPTGLDEKLSWGRDVMAEIKMLGQQH